MSKLIFLSFLMVASVLVAGCNPFQKTTIELKDAQVKMQGDEVQEEMGTTTDPDSLEKEVDSYQIEEEAL
jgi:ABC-type Fe3+-citrate transport system substrate-binding protein